MYVSEAMRAETCDRGHESRKHVTEARAMRAEDIRQRSGEQKAWSRGPKSRNHEAKARKSENM